MDAPAYLADCARHLDPALEAALRPGPAPGLGDGAPDLVPERLYAAMRHLVFPGGKRLRPGFAFAACEAFGAPPQRALPVAIAVELVHAYSLVHDDLPCMDDDDERRGRPTVHVAFDEATAVLAGDALQARAFEVLASADGVAPAVALQALADVARAASADALVGGQALDLGFTAGGDDEARRVLDVHLRKSAALIAAAATAGARFGGADAEQAETIHRFGLEVGVAFQIADDLLDAEDGDEPCSLVRVLGPAAARVHAEQGLERALSRIDGLGEAGAALRELARAAVRRSE